MSAEVPTGGDTVSTTVKLASPDWEMRARVTVPVSPTPLRQLLPMVQALTDAVVDAASSWSEQQGKSISCRKGCGACCRQLVPITEPEAHRIAALVNDLPEPRRGEIRARFARARQRLAEAGLLEALLEPEQWTGPGEAARWTQYFQLRIPCPFLEDEACSIHPDRPLACREYLVSSPPEHCAQPTPETVQRVALPMEIWPALAQTARPSTDGKHLHWVPLIVAPEWAQAHSEEPPPRPGLDWLKELMTHLSGKPPQPTETVHDCQ